MQPTSQFKAIWRIASQHSASAHRFTEVRMTKKTQQRYVVGDFTGYCAMLDSSLTSGQDRPL